MQYFSYFSFLLIVFIFCNGLTGCRIYESRQQCNQAKACVWDSRGCSVGSRPLGAESKGDTIQDNFDSTFSLKKAD